MLLVLAVQAEGHTGYLATAGPALPSVIQHTQTQTGQGYKMSHKNVKRYSSSIFPSLFSWISERRCEYEVVKKGRRQAKVQIVFHRKVLQGVG